MVRDWDFFFMDLLGFGISCFEKVEVVFWGDCLFKEEDDLFLIIIFIGDKYLGINYK